MKIDRVKATIRYSQDSGKGAWKSLEIGAEGTVDERELWQAALAQLYADLGREFKQLWSSGTRAEVGSGDAVAAAAPSEQEEPLPVPVTPENNRNGAASHWCQQHQTEYRRFEKDGRSWYSHRLPDGAGWHNEPSSQPIG